MSLLATPNFLSHRHQLKLPIKNSPLLLRDNNYFVLSVVRIFAPSTAILSPCERERKMSRALVK